MAHESDFLTFPFHSAFNVFKTFEETEKKKRKLPIIILVLHPSSRI